MKTIIIVALFGAAIATTANAQSLQNMQMRQRAEAARERAQQHADEVRQQAYERQLARLMHRDDGLGWRS